MKNWEEIFLTFEADSKQRNVPRMHILWLRAQCLICVKTDIEFPRGPEKPRNEHSKFNAVTAMFWNSQSKKSNFLTWPDLAFGFAHPWDLGTRLALCSKSTKVQEQIGCHVKGVQWLSPLSECCFYHLSATSKQRTTVFCVLYLTN